MIVHPFDTVAADYDRGFSESWLGRALREMVRARLAESFKVGDRILELNCGTGEDALWLAQRGIEVVATDVSSQMLAIAERKVSERGLTGKVQTRRLDLAHPELDSFEAKFDGAFSNFGGLNCVADLRPVAEMLREVVKPGGKLIFVIMSRWCAWEIVWHLMHWQPRTAFRRLKRQGIEAKIGHSRIQVWYPSLRSVKQTFEPGFKPVGATGLGVFLPPSYLAPVIAKRPRLCRLLYYLEDAAASLFPFTHLADHMIIELERKEV